MTDWQGIWLATIAVALVVTAIMQVTLLAVLIRLAMQATQATKDLGRQLQPFIDKAHRITDDAGRATALALAQVERVDELMATTAERVDEVVGIVQHTILQPIRQGTALMAGVKAALSMFTRGRDRQRPARDEDDPLFIG